MVYDSLEEKDSNMGYGQFLNAYNYGFDKYFPKKIRTITKSSPIPRKEWMTFGLAKSCKTKSDLFKEYKNSKSAEARDKFIAYRNKLQKLLHKAEKEYYSKKLNDCHGDQKRS